MTGVQPRQGPLNKQVSCRVKGSGEGQADNRGGILRDRTGGGLAKKENEANELRGPDVSVVLSSSSLA